jgi:uncharacterized repeat protein (TIGR03803 family)
MKMIVKPLCVMMAVLALTARAQTFTVLKTFNPNINATGLHARGTLVQGPDGSLYGVATDGGAGAAGVVFRVQTNATGFTVLKNFSLTDVISGTNSDGANPQAGLLLSGSTLFGTTANGGSSGYGTVFSVATNGNSFTVLRNFSAPNPNTGTNSDGANPAAALILSGSALYGTTQNGGAGAAGTIFKLNTNGTGFTNTYSFTGGNDGGNPVAPLLLSGSTLYGTAQNGGLPGYGTVFSVSTNGTGFNPIYPFNGSGTDGANPVAGLVLSGSMLYGTTQYGDSGDGSDDGTVFGVSINGNDFTNLYSFSGNDGFNPVAELILSGSTLYGTTGNGGFQGVPTPYGTVFKISTNGTGFATVNSLDGDDGWGPQGGLVLSGSTLYGTTFSGGLLPTVFAPANGTVFSVNINGDGLTDLCVFTVPTGAAGPETGLALSGNTLYGTTGAGGTNNNGTLFEINTNGNGYAEIRDFSITDSNGANPDGADPRAVLVLSGSTFYGSTRYGGTGGFGSLFKMNSDGTGFTNIFSFDNANPGTPTAALVVSGSTLYGTTVQTGSGGFGSVFSLNTNGGGFTNIYSFNGTDGEYPTAGLTLSGNILYGTTQNGGAGQGNLFQVNTNGGGFTNIYSFTGGSDGANPGSVLVLSGTTLYGTAFHGGSVGQGTAFKINTDRIGFSVLQNFVGTNSDGAGAGDLLLSGGTLYGTTAYGGSSNQGTVFQMDTAGNNFTVLKNFSGDSDGANPNTTLVLSSNVLYGTTQNGGLSGYGTVFSLSLPAVVNPNTFQITAITKQGNNLLVTWLMGVGPTNALQATAGGTLGSYTTNGFADIFIVTNNTTTGSLTNYLDMGAATNIPSRFYRARLAL